MEKELTSLSADIPQFRDLRTRGYARQTEVISKPPIQMGGCLNHCAAPPETRIGRSVRHFAVDFMDILISPLKPGPLHGFSKIEDLNFDTQQANSSASTDLPDLREACSPKIASQIASGGKIRTLDPELSGAQVALDRMAEFQLCVEMLRDCFDAYVEDSERNIAVSARDTLDAVEETLLRITELAMQAVRRPPDMSPSARDSPKRPDQEDHHDGLQRCLLSSGLGISGMLEAALEDLSDGLMQPGDSERTDWQRWDELYVQLLSQTTGMDPTESRASMQGMRKSMTKRLRASMTTLLPEDTAGFGTLIREGSAGIFGDEPPKWCGSDWKCVQEAPDCVPQRCCRWPA